MALFDTIRAGASGAVAGFEVERSLRFNDDDSPRINRTPSSSGNRQTWTKSFWVKRGQIMRTMLTAYYISSTDVAAIEFSDTHQLQFYDYYNGYRLHLVTTQVFRDPTAWYHIVIALDTTQSTASDRAKIYVNGEQITSFSTATYPSQNLNVSFNQNVLEAWGTEGTNQRLHFDGYMAEIIYIDGLQLTPTSFGETDATTGQWNPIDTSGLTYGTNGYRLQFADNSGTSATTLGKDTSGNGNNWTPVNFGTGDAVKDTPTNNFCTLSDVNDSKAGSNSEANLRYTGGSGNGTIASTFGIRHTDTQGYYFEARIISGNQANRLFVGIGYTSTNWINVDARGANDDSWVLRNGDGVFIHNSSVDGETTGAGALSVGDVMQFAVKGSKIWVGKNGSYFFSGNPSGDSTPKFNDIASTWTPVADVMTSNVVQFNFGQDSSFSNTITAQGNTDANGHGDFSYAPPTGFLALCSANLPDPTIKLPDKHFETVTYTGSGSGNQSITSLNFQPDWVWIKARSVASYHVIADSVRGVGKLISSNGSEAESDDSTTQTAFSAFLSNGFTVGYNVAWYTNGSPSGSETQVAWNWNAGDTDGKTYTVKVVSDSGNKYRFDDFGTSAVTLDLAEGGTYIFDQSDSSNAGHPLRFSTTSNGTHGGGSEYTTGVTTAGTPGSSGAYTQIVVAASAPTLYYYCSVHSGMGGQANTNSTLGSSNFDGSNQTTVKVNATAGFSIISYTGTGSLNTIGHGLGVVPNVYIIKNRDASDNWIVYTTGIDGSLDFLYFNLTNTKTNSGNTAPTSSVIEISGATTNDSGNKHICYAFSEVAGYSKFGSYTSNGNTEGTFVFLGFKPALIIFKNSSSTEAWSMFDNKRDTFNPVEKFLRPSGNNADTSGSNDIDFLSNGFKARTSNNPNVGTNTYIYLAFAESPFKNARAR